MSYRNYVLLTAAVILSLAGCLAYLYVDRLSMNASWWNAAIQNQEEALRRINSVEVLLEPDQLDEVKTELHRHRQRTLTSLEGMINTRFAPGSPNREFARRVYCAEVAIDSCICEPSTTSSL